MKYNWRDCSGEKTRGEKLSCDGFSTVLPGPEREES